MRLRVTGGRCAGILPNALVLWLLSIGGREVDFKRMNLIPLRVGSPALRYRQELLQAGAWGSRFWCVHGGIISPPTSPIDMMRIAGR